MRSTKFYSFILAFAMASALPGTMAAQDGKATLNGGIAMYNACTNNNTIVYAPGSTEVSFHQDASQAGVHVLFHNDGTDLTSQNPYRLNLEANAQLDGPVACNEAGTCYDVPYHSVWVAQGSGSNFTMDGTVRVVVDQTGTPLRSNLMSWQLACVQQ